MGVLTLPTSDSGERRRYSSGFSQGGAENQYKTLPAKLRMNVIGKPGVDKVDFELWSLAVSAVNGCGMCLTAHEHELRKGGLGAEQVQAAVRIAAVVHAVAAALDGEAALSSTLAAAAE